jgi:hypothetical protein
MKIHIANFGLAALFDRKSDIIYGLYHSLKSLSHEVTLGQNTLETKALNLIIGSDIIAGDTDAILTLIRSKCDYTIYEVENYNGVTINYRDNFNLENYQTLLRNAVSIITPYKYNLRALETTCRGITPVHYARWGFHESMVKDNINRQKSFKYDALFFGLAKGSRAEKLYLLKERYGKGMQLVNNELPFTIRDYFMSECRFGLTLSYGNTDDFVNPFRIMSMVANNMPVLADHQADEDGYLKLCEQYDFDGLLDAIENLSTTSNDLIEKSRSIRLEDNLRGLL